MLFIILPTAFENLKNKQTIVSNLKKKSLKNVFVFISTLIDDISENTAVHKKTESHENRLNG